MGQFFRIAGIALLCLGTAPGALAQRNGNVWDWRAHEPDPTVVDAEERKAGISSQPQQERETSEVERLEHTLLKQAEH